MKNDSPFPYEISTEQARLDIGMIHEFLGGTYWAKGIPRELVERSIQNSLAFGAYRGAAQIGFARVISDFATFAYVADVFVIPEYRGKGISKLILSAILAHPNLQGIRRLLLATLDAHGLYAQFGFKPLVHPDHFMSVHKPDVYRDASSLSATA